MIVAGDDVASGEITMPTDGDDEKSTYVKGKNSDEVLSRVIREHDLFGAQREKRVDLLTKLEEHEKDKKTGFFGFLGPDAIDAGDIPAIGDALMSLGELDQLNLIIDSPGGDGTTAEKIIELCRSYCKEFRVIVPNRAKSAATIIALGADEIVMGLCSELGPIDAQIPVIVGGIPHYISAQSFIDARNTLEERYKTAIKGKEDGKPFLQQMLTLDQPFIDHCEKLMAFSREVAKKYLEKHMFAKTTPAKRKPLIKNIVRCLSSVEEFQVHGRMINANAAKTELKLNVRVLAKDSEYWKDLWNYYVRANVQISSGGKLIETKNEILIGRRG